MSEAGIEKVAVTLNEKPLALNSDTGKVAWRQDPTSKAPALENANSGDSLDWEIGWKSPLLKNNQSPGEVFPGPAAKAHGGH